MFFRWKGKAKPEAAGDEPTVLVHSHEPRRGTEWPARDGGHAGGGHAGGGQPPGPPPAGYDRTVPPQYDRGAAAARDRTVPPQHDRGAPHPQERGHERAAPQGHERGPPQGYERAAPQHERTAPPMPRGREVPLTPDDERTRVAGRHHPPEPAPHHAEPPPPEYFQDERTRLFKGASNEAVEKATRLSDDPVVGWLVVVGGPGKGRSIEIGSGANSIGRSPGQQIRLDFGDDLISRERHAVLIFDPRTSRFFLERGDGRNLTYVGEEPVLTPVALSGGETIVIGKTQCRFVPLCGEHFSWA